MRYSRNNVKASNLEAQGQLIGELMACLDHDIEHRDVDMEAVACVAFTFALTSVAGMNADKAAKLANEYAASFARGYELQRWISESQN
jgi:hypothetical protein